MVGSGARLWSLGRPWDHLGALIAEFLAKLHRLEAGARVFSSGGHDWRLLHGDHILFPSHSTWLLRRGSLRHGRKRGQPHRDFIFIFTLASWAAIALPVLLLQFSHRVGALLVLLHAASRIDSLHIA